MELAKRVLRYLKPYKGRIVLAVISMILNAGLSILFFDRFQDLIDTMIQGLTTGETTLVQLNWIIIGIFFIFLFRGIFQYGEKYFTAYVSQNAVKDLRNNLYQHLQSLSLDFYTKNKTGEIMSRTTNDVGKLEGAIASGAIGIFSQMFTLLGGIGKLLYDNWSLTLISFFLFPVIGYVIDVFNKRIRKVSKRAQVKIGNLSDVLQETISGIRVVKSFGREEYEYDRFEEENYANFRANLKNSQLKATLTPVTEFLAAMSFIVVLWYGGRQVIAAKMTPGELVGFFSLLMYITNPLKSITRLSGTIQGALAAAERIFEIIDIQPTIKDKVGARELTEVDGYIHFKDLVFSYNNDELALDKINLKAKPGQVIALVGSSGAGKSTLVNMIPRFYDPDSGEITIDGVDIRDITIKSLRDKIGIVPQETVLFSGTIADNILYGRLDASEEEIIKAAKAANAHDFIEAFPEGYESEIGERGAGLSGGQKQRIAIARAILKDPSILILDEATSALDTESEALVQDALDRLMKNRTTFVIAHRLSTILDADKIVVMERGKVVEMGSHEELLAKDGLYKKLYEIQFNK
ncbi:ATP-binding cassette, subfamily B, MsbA [Orenia metallireducens]|jgi:subfamily B ATP-binding cassette protein MsbA|uniref:ATP-binding cassette, subfamily B, MsbA n=1 Tax=Orenia metallireducens TaxID=1413210 RepID=A0A285GLZ4_9FIRM|nr:lipid A export permease/ATP-binding protein MsbA [Orenia metallireducens]PRX35723.1 ATP-binding cassette, subfamily B, MsbA [Orenia metallireducens]SNY24343.1 ATP-binding cassette, subfamily B, MsbA [Orenia metallireducens]